MFFLMRLALFSVHLLWGARQAATIRNTKVASVLPTIKITHPSVSAKTPLAFIAAPMLRAV
jgi:hypothetical protein